MELLRKNSLKNLNDNKKSYKRTRSDDVYQRLLKHNDESLKRAITDGYSKFMIPKIFEDEHLEDDDKKKLKKKRQYQKCDIEQCNFDNFHKIEFNNIKHNKYITRTSKAGTLIIREETFTNPNWRRRKSDIQDLDFKENDEGNLRKLPHSKSATSVSNCNNVMNIRKNGSVRNINLNNYKSVEETDLKNDENSDFQTNYIVQEPSSDYSRKNSEAFISKENSIKKKDRRKLQKCLSDISVLTATISSSSSSSITTKEKEESRQKRGSSKGK